MSIKDFMSSQRPGTISLVFALLLFASCAMDRDQTLFVSSFVSQGERTPLWTGDQQYSTTNADYDREQGKITIKGEQNMYTLGNQARARYVRDDFMPQEYDPATVLVRGPNDNVSILSGYSYLLGLYPDGIEGVDLMENYDNLRSVPVTEQEVDRVRSDVGGVVPKCGTQRADFYPGNDDKEFLIKPNQLYPGQRSKINDQLNHGRREFENKYGNELYERLARATGRNPNDFNFATTLKYLDDYIVAQENSASSRYSVDRDTDNLITEYYKHYFGKGLFHDEALTRVFTDSYFTNLIQELFLKRNAVEGQYYDGKLVEKLQHSVHVGNHQTYAAILHALGERDHYRLDFAKPITWELIKRDDNYYVKALNDGQPLYLEGNANDNGEVELSTLFEYLCSKLYYGDDILTAKGAVDPDDYNDKTIHCLGEKTFEQTLHHGSLTKALSEFDKTFKPCDDASRSRYNENASPQQPQDGSHSGESWSLTSSSSSEPVQSQTSWSSTLSDSYQPISTAPAPSNSYSNNYQQSEPVWQNTHSQYSSNNRAEDWRSYIVESAVLDNDEQAYTQEFYGGKSSPVQQVVQEQRPSPVQEQRPRPVQEVSYQSQKYEPVYQPPKEIVVVEKVPEPASILKSLVENSPAYDSNGRQQMNAPRGSETFVAPIQEDDDTQYIQKQAPVQNYQVVQQYPQTQYYQAPISDWDPPQAQYTSAQSYQVVNSYQPSQVVQGYQPVNQQNYATSPQLSSGARTTLSDWKGEDEKDNNIVYATQYPTYQQSYTYAPQSTTYAPQSTTYAQQPTTYSTQGAPYTSQQTYAPTTTTTTRSYTVPVDNDNTRTQNSPTTQTQARSYNPTTSTTNSNYTPVKYSQASQTQASAAPQTTKRQPIVTSRPQAQSYPESQNYSGRQMQTGGNSEITVVYRDEDSK